MVDTNRPISAVKSEIITNIPCLHVTISIRKNCGEFALVLFNLEQKQVSVIIYVRFGIFRYCQHSMMMIWWTLQAIDHWLLNLSHWWCQLIWSICFVNCTIFKPFLFRVDTFIFVILIFISNSRGQYYFGIISFPIDGFNHWKVVFYQFGYAVHDEVGDCTIVMYLHTAMVNNKKQ